MTLPSTSSQSTGTQQQQQQQQQSQHFLLKWNNHRTNLINVFEHLLQNENLVDVTLAVEGKFLKAHKIVLSACSPYFQSMFVNQTPEDKHPILIFHDLKHSRMKTLLEFMYRGEISIDERDLSDVLKIAEALSIRGLSSFESDEDDSGTDGPGSPQSGITNTNNCASSSSAASANTSANTFQHQNDFFNSSSQSINTAASPSSSSQHSLDNQNTEYGNQQLQQSSSSSSSTKVGTSKSAGSSHCDSKSSLINSTVNGTKSQGTKLKIKKEKLGKKGGSGSTSTAASTKSNSSTSAPPVHLPSLSNKAPPTINNISNVNSAPPPTIPEIPLKKKRGRKPKLLNQDKATVDAAMTAAAMTCAVVPKLAKSKAQQAKPPPTRHHFHLPQPPITPSKPVRRRIPKRLATSSGGPGGVKRERLSDPDSKNHTDDDYNGLADLLNASSEPLSEMSVRGLDLFKYAAIEDGVYRCMECEKLQIPKTFKNKYSFQRHAFLYHEGNMRKVFPCPVCYREFSRPDKMKNHLRSIHEGTGSTNGSNGSGGNGSGGGGGGGKSASSPSMNDFAATSSSFGLGSRMNEHCDF